MTSFLRSVWHQWKQLARKIGDVQAGLLFSLIYFLLIWPFSLLTKFLIKPFEVSGKTSTWHDKDGERKTVDINALRKQY